MAPPEMAMTLRCRGEHGDVLVSFDRPILDEGSQRMVMGSTITITDTVSGEQRQVVVEGLQFQLVTPEE